MATIRKHVATTTVPKAVRRGNAFPLDASAVWYSYNDMAKYAAKDPTAYVGQILSLISGIGEASVYVIKNVEGELIPIGAGAVGGNAVDNRSVTIYNGEIALNNWGVRFYKWDRTEKTYVLTQVDDQNPWMLGLEPRVALNEAGVPELAWYEAQEVIIDGALVETLKELIGTPENPAEGTVFGELEKKLNITGGVLTGTLILEDGAPAASEKVVDSKIAAAVASAGTLKREIVETLPPIAEADVNTIYMVKASTLFPNNHYEEYMVINGAYERIGGTEINLEDYIPVIRDFTVGDIPEIDGNGTLISSGISAALVNEHLVDNSKHVTGADRQYWDSIKEIAENAAKKVDEMPVIDEYEYEKLIALPPITGIGEGLVLDESGLLTAQVGMLTPPIATEDSLGSVKSSSEINNIYVNPETGIMSVNDISVEKLYVPDGVEFVIAGGSSQA
jgi:hypothetical protein